jgi:hypothetical protein
MNTMGCPTSKPFKCASGFCIDPNYEVCSVQDNMLCPTNSNYTYKCPNGICVKTKADCIVTSQSLQDIYYCITETQGSTNANLYLCGDGKCVASSE